mgnify:CR=1 FL=1
MKLLLTSAGLMNKVLIDALQEMVLKPFGDLNAVFIPTAANAEAGDKTWLINDLHAAAQLKFKSLDVVDIAALKPELSLKRIEGADVIFVGGGNTFYLSYWAQKSGLMDALPELLKTKVYVGISAGSMIVTDNLRAQTFENSRVLSDAEYEEFGPDGESSTVTAKLVDFVVRPHLNSKWFPNIRIDNLEKIAKEINNTMYALDDQSAVKVVDGIVTVVSDGTWQKFN